MGWSLWLSLTRALQLSAPSVVPQYCYVVCNYLKAWRLALFHCFLSCVSTVPFGWHRYYQSSRKSIKKDVDFLRVASHFQVWQQLFSKHYLQLLLGSINLKWGNGFNFYIFDKCTWVIKQPPINARVIEWRRSMWHTYSS